MQRKSVNYDMNKFRLLSKETREVWEKGLVVFPTDKITKNNLFKNIYDNPIIPKDLQDESTKIKTRQEISTLSC